MRKLETYLLLRLVCVHVHVFGMYFHMCEIEIQIGGLLAALCVYVFVCNCLFLSKMQSKTCILGKGMFFLAFLSNFITQAILPEL